MRPDPVATTTTATLATALSVEPSRAWILGLVVSADGTRLGSEPRGAARVADLRVPGRVRPPRGSLNRISSPLTAERSD